MEMSVTSIRGRDLSVFQGYIEREAVQSAPASVSPNSKCECIVEEREREGKGSHRWLKAYMIKMQFS